MVDAAQHDFIARLFADVLQRLLREPHHREAVLPGADYAAMPFQALYDRLCTALRGNRPRLVLEVIGPDSSTTLVFEDGSKTSGPPRRRPGL